MQSQVMLAALLLASAASAQGVSTPEAPMIRGDTPATSNGWVVTPLFTISESVGAFRPVGKPDGIGAFAREGSRALVLVNAELSAGDGYQYTLASGASLRGARVTGYTVSRVVRDGVAAAGVQRANLAYDTIIDRSGQVVTSAGQINESGHPTRGLARLCSAQGIQKGSFGFVDEVFLTGEETGKPSHPHGGSEWALDVRNRTLWAVPAVGRGAWENMTPLDTGDADTIALLGGDDTAGAPLYLYVGQKSGRDDAGFLARNGLAQGALYAWRADSGDLTPQTFNGLNAARSGTWVALTVRNLASAGTPGYDSQGYADIDVLQAEADALGCFSFSRPEDVDTNPLDGTQAVLASTGRGSSYPADNWGTTYAIDVDFSALSATLTIIHDADDLTVPDTGIRSPDNLDWAGNGKIYVQEDRSTSPSSLFGASTGIEASVWELDPVTRAFERVAEVDRSAVAPAGSTDSCANSIGCWETSGILDVTAVFETLPGERLLLGAVQAHGIQNGPIGGNSALDEGGQLFFLSKLGDE